MTGISVAPSNPPLCRALLSPSPKGRQMSEISRLYELSAEIPTLPADTSAGIRGLDWQNVLMFDSSNYFGQPDQGRLRVIAGRLLFRFGALQSRCCHTTNFVHHSRKVSQVDELFTFF